jgi:hypothetical protein
MPCQCLTQASPRRESYHAGPERVNLEMVQQYTCLTVYRTQDWSRARQWCCGSPMMAVDMIKLYMVSTWSIDYHMQIGRCKHLDHMPVGVNEKVW